MTVRFTPEAWKVVRQLAAENGVSQAELVRIAVAGNLEKHLGSVRFIDVEQGDEIKKAVVSLMDTTSRILNELNRIGVNYNQGIRLKQIARKYKGSERDFELTRMKVQEESKVKSECRGFSKEDFDELAGR